MNYFFMSFVVSDEQSNFVERQSRTIYMVKASFEADIIRNEPVSHFLHHLTIQMAFNTEY
jgi:hypothetical protein